MKINKINIGVLWKMTDFKMVPNKFWCYELANAAIPYLFNAPQNLQPSSSIEHPNVDDEQEDSFLSLYDQRTWDNLDNTNRDILI